MVWRYGPSLQKSRDRERQDKDQRSGIEGEQGSRKDANKERCGCCKNITYGCLNWRGVVVWCGGMLQTQIEAKNMLWIDRTQENKQILERRLDIFLLTLTMISSSSNDPT